MPEPPADRTLTSASRYAGISSGLRHPFHWSFRVRFHAAIIWPVCGTLRADKLQQDRTVVNNQQLTLGLDPNLAGQHRSLKECVAARVYAKRGGIAVVAALPALPASAGVTKRGRA